MSQALAEAFARASQLPESEQEALARLVTAEVEERSSLAGTTAVLQAPSARVAKRG